MLTAVSAVKGFVCDSYTVNGSNNYNNYKNNYHNYEKSQLITFKNKKQPK